MERSLGRAFIFSFIVVIALSFLFFIVGYSILGTLENHFTRASSHPTYIVLWLTEPYTWFPWDLILAIVDESTHIGLRIMYIGFLVSLVVGAIVAAIFGGDFSNSLGGWVLTSLVCIVILIVTFFIDPYNTDWICWPCDVGEAVIHVLVAGVVNLLIFGGITLLIVLVVGSYGK
jgi:hypothetical protein